MNLEKRMKSFYESRTKFYIPRRTFTVIRIDGKAFHTYTKGLERPFDVDFINHMNQTAEFLCKNIQGAKFAYVQSDEISLVLTDFETVHTDAWFNGNIQKMASISSSLATGIFNNLRNSITNKIAFFDSRVFSIPEKTEVFNYFIWRQQDAIRNSISSTAQAYFSTKELHKMKKDDMLGMLRREKNVDWNKFDDGLKYGRIVLKEEVLVDSQYHDNQIKRNKWKSKPSFLFSNDSLNDLNLI
jgi:tRNA(His) 5'-end guanylyltransferase